MSKPKNKPKTKDQLMLACVKARGEMEKAIMKYAAAKQACPVCLGRK